MFALHIISYNYVCTLLFNIQPCLRTLFIEDEHNFSPTSTDNAFQCRSCVFKSYIQFTCHEPVPAQRQLSKHAVLRLFSTYLD